MILRMPTTRNRLLLTGAVLLAVIIIGAFIRDRLGIQLDVEYVRVFAEGLGAAGPILFVFIIAGRSLLALPSQIVLIAAGLCFGTVVGAVVGGAGLMLSGLALFLMARYAGREAIERRVGARGRRLLDFASHRSGAVTFAIACGYPLIPLTPIQTAAGLTPMPTTSFITAAFVGGATRASFFAYFGNALIDSSWRKLLYATGLFALVVAVPLAFPACRTWLRAVFSALPKGETVQERHTEGADDS